MLTRRAPSKRCAPALWTSSSQKLLNTTVLSLVGRVANVSISLTGFRESVKCHSMLKHTIYWRCFLSKIFIELFIRVAYDRWRHYRNLTSTSIVSNLLRKKTCLKQAQLTRRGISAPRFTKRRLTRWQQIKNGICNCEVNFFAFHSLQIMNRNRKGVNPLNGSKSRRCLSS